jgi:hypothetical protein
MNEQIRINTQINLLRERARLTRLRDTIEYDIEYDEETIRQAKTIEDEEFDTYKSITDLQDLEGITQTSELILRYKQKIQEDREQMTQLKKQVKELEDTLGIERDFVYSI